MAQINAYLTFNGNCREAMSYYKNCFGGELSFKTVAETPMADRCPEGMLNQIMHSMLIKEELVVMGTDMVGPGGFNRGNNVTLSVNCDSEDQIQQYFFYLSSDGKVLEPLKKMFWGAYFASLADKFGVQWMLNYDKKAIPDAST